MSFEAVESQFEGRVAGFSAREPRQISSTRRSLDHVAGRRSLLHGIPAAGVESATSRLSSTNRRRAAQDAASPMTGRISISSSANAPSPGTFLKMVRYAGGDGARRPRSSSAIACRSGCVEATDGDYARERHCDCSGNRRRTVFRRGSWSWPTGHSAWRCSPGAVHSRSMALAHPVRLSPRRDIFLPDY